ncbi:MAG: hypothetical protein K6G11_02560 [Lachnospiraceae bacterium]|nr:hypothetical protein [Lachnospiraceae bacterium]
MPGSKGSNNNKKATTFNINNISKVIDFKVPVLLGTDLSESDKRAMIIKTFNAQNSFEDRLITYLKYQMYCNAANDAVENGNLEVDEKNLVDNLKDDEQRIINNKIKNQKEAFVESFGVKKSYNPEKASKLDDIMSENIQHMIAGDYSVDSVIKNFERMGNIITSYTLELGKEYKKNLKKFPENDKYRKEKAMYLTYRGGSLASVMDNALNTTYRAMFGDITEDDRFNEGILNAFRFSKDMSLDDYIKLCRLSNKDKKELKEELKLAPNVDEKNITAYDALKYDVITDQIKADKTLIQDTINNINEAEKQKAKDENRQYVPLATNVIADMVADQLKDSIKTRTHEEIKEEVKGGDNYVPKTAEEVVNRLEAEDRASNTTVLEDMVKEKAKKEYKNYMDTFISDSFTNCTFNAMQKSRLNLDSDSLEIIGDGTTIHGNDFNTKPIKDWINGEGANMIVQEQKMNKFKSYSQLNNELLSGELVNFRSQISFTDTYDFNELIEKNVDPTLLRGAINDIKDASKRHPNSTKKLGKDFQDVLNAAEVYEFSVSAKEGGNVLDSRAAFIKSCKKFFKGREKDSSKELNQKCFDDLLVIMGEILPRDKFTEFVGEINSKRGKEKYHIKEDKYLRKDNDYNTLYSNLRAAERVREDRAQVKSAENVLKVVGENKKVIEGVDSLFGKVVEPYVNVYSDSQKKNVEEKFSLEDVFGSLGHMSIYNTLVKDKIEDKIHQIGPSKEEFELSNKEFAALAFAGSLTNDACLEANHTVDSMRIKDKDKDGLKVENKSFINDLITKEKNTKNENKQLNRINFGRHMAKEAMDEYAKGNKMALAYVLASGIRAITKDVLTKPEFNSSLAVNAEMLSRMREMMNRDPELYKLAFKNGLKKSDMTNVKEVISLGVLQNKYEKADKMYESDNPTKEEKIERATNFVLNDMFKKFIGDDKHALHSIIRNPKAYNSLISGARDLVTSNDLHKLSYTQIQQRFDPNKIETYNLTPKKIKSKKAECDKLNEKYAKLIKKVQKELPKAKYRNIKTSFIDMKAVKNEIAARKAKEAEVNKAKVGRSL